MLIILPIFAIAFASDQKPTDDGPSDSFTQCVLTTREDGKLKKARFELVPSAEGHRVYEAHANSVTVRIVNNAGRTFAIGKDELTYVADRASYPARKAFGDKEKRKERAVDDQMRAKLKAEADAKIKGLVDQGCDPVNDPAVRSVRQRLAELTAIPFTSTPAHNVPVPEPSSNARDPKTLLSMMSIDAKGSRQWTDSDNYPPFRNGTLKDEDALFAESLGADGSLFGQGDLTKGAFTVHCASGS